METYTIKTSSEGNVSITPSLNPPLRRAIKHEQDFDNLGYGSTKSARSKKWDQYVKALAAAAKFDGYRLDYAWYYRAD